jgi:hypothetical protein
MDDDDDDNNDEPKTEIPASMVSFPSELPDTFRRHLLNSKEDSQKSLLHMAKFFRHQSSMMLRQAALLEQIALNHDVHNESFSSSLQQPQIPLQDHLNQTSVTTMVSKAVAVMQSTQAQLDRMESRLHPWDDDATVSKNGKIYSSNITTSLRGGVRAYSMFMKDEFNHCAKRLGTTDCSTVNKELSRLWKEMTVEKKQDYQRRAADECAARQKETRRQRVENQEAAAAAAAAVQIQIPCKRRRSET